MSNRLRRHITQTEDFVVVYIGTDPHFHRRHDVETNKPFCQAARNSGVLMTPKRAVDFGLMACSECWVDALGEMAQHD